MNRRSIVLILAVTSGAFLALQLFSPLVPARGIQEARVETEKPLVKFNHAFHLKDAGLECAACHPGAKASKSVSDNLHPGHEQCQQCHQEQIDSTCGYCHLTPDNIAPRQVPARSLTFSHQSHVAMKDVACTTCHEGIEEATTSSGEHLPVMDRCASCHDSFRATRQCEACHRNVAQLLPKDHLRSDFRRFHGEESRLGKMNVACATCHTESFCQECHGPVELKGFGNKDLSGDPRPRTSPKDQPALTMPQRVHGLNYRFTHGIDAKAKQSECATCHDTRAFCVECHEAGGNINQSKFKPVSHSLPGFTTLGKGSGGGIHAQEARRDMESCVGCHDVPGQDPTCLTCHTANGQVR